MTEQTTLYFVTEIMNSLQNGHMKGPESAILK